MILRMLTLMLITAVSIVSSAEPTNSTTDSQPYLDLHSVISPPMPLSQALPISISTENQRLFQNNPTLNELERKNAEIALNSRNFPWMAMISAFGVIIAIILIRSSTTAPIHSEDDPEAAERKRRESVDILQKLIVNTPKTNEDANAYMLRLDNALRKFLDSTFHIGASTSTTQELASSTVSLPGIDPLVSKQIIALFQQTDKIKFAQISSTQNDVENFTNDAKVLFLSLLTIKGQ